jgi:hypothetical protein
MWKGKRERGREERETVNIIKVYYMYAWQYHETHYSM